MATRTGPIFRNRLTDIQHNNCISNLYAWVQALQTTVNELSTASTNPKGESSNAFVSQIQRLQLDTGPCESVQEFLQRLFNERDINDIPHAPRQDDLSKKVKLKVADFSRQFDVIAFLDWLTLIEDYFTWYHI